MSFNLLSWSATTLILHGIHVGCWYRVVCRFPMSRQQCCAKGISHFRLWWYVRHFIFSANVDRLILKEGSERLRTILNSKQFGRDGQFSRMMVREILSRRGCLRQWRESPKWLGSASSHICYKELCSGTRNPILRNTRRVPISSAIYVLIGATGIT